MANVEKKIATKGFNKTKCKYSSQKSILELFWKQVQEQPNSTAVVCDNKILSYSKLAENSFDLAAYLQYLKVTRDNFVGIFMQPSIELMVGVWGILASGGAYLPLSPEYPDERLKYMIEDSGAKIIVTQDDLKGRLSELAPQTTQIVSLTDVKRVVVANRKDSRFKLKTNLHPNNLAYIIYTSGSTGKPKGVMIEHHSIVNQMQWLKSTFDLNNQSVILQKTLMSFDAAQWEILAPCFGSKVIMGSSDLCRNPQQLIETIIKYNVTTLQCVPSLLQLLLDTNKFHHCKTLTQIFIGGEALPKHLVIEYLKVLPKCNLVNLYGPTECTINTSSFVIDPDTIEKAPNTISIGTPINNIQYYILNNCQKRVAIGEIGELYIGGEGLARGYLHQPELSAAKFVDNPFYLENKQHKLYKTGDLAYWNSDGTVQYACRSDNQVKLRGFRIELDEIKSVIETHDWVKNSAVILKNDSYTGYQNLIAFIELNPKEAALMDQGNHDSHHQSKASKAQVMMQLSNKGCREKNELYGKYVVDLPGKLPTKKQKNKVFARKTYRFFEGGEIKKNDILKLITSKTSGTDFSKIENMSYSAFGEILRYFGQYISEERLLPKYGYASPGALYATQMYLELNKIGNLQSGYYYYNPINHQLVLVKNKVSSAKIKFKVHFVGKKSAIEPIYKNNIQEVLEIETGHIVGLFEEILPEYGLSIKDCEYVASIKKYLEVAEEDFYLGAFQIISGKKQQMKDLVDVYVQIHSSQVGDLKTGQYKYKNGHLEKISDEIILKKHVVAINQEAYNRSSFGITVISKSDKNWMSYINLGRKLQKLQMNDMNIGFMSSGYSSKTGNDLPSAKRIQDILGNKLGPCYFFIGGRVSDEQVHSYGMKEDAVHMKGLDEMLKDNLRNFLPDYMLPNKIIVLDKIPLSVNGKIDFNELNNKNVGRVQRKYRAPRTEIEQKIQNIWQSEIRGEDISINDNFFEWGGNSLIAVSLICKINNVLNCSLSMQVIFESPTIEKLALKISCEKAAISSRLVQLQAKGAKKPIYCWPGLGGYCMNLRLLAEKIETDQPFYGIQTYGINENELPYPTLKMMAAEDIKMIKKIQSMGPYTLWGYSFGARVAFEAAYQLKQSGESVENLYLIAPGSPKVQCSKVLNNNGQATYSNKAYVAILFSIFMGNVTNSALEECLQTVDDEESFVKYITKENSKFEPELVRRIINVVSKTYEFQYSLNELNEREFNTPITIFKAKGDDYSFIENSNHFSTTIFELKSDHYNLLKGPNIEELVKIIKAERGKPIGEKKRSIQNVCNECE